MAVCLMGRGRSRPAHTPDVVIVGSGCSGIAAGVKLRRAGIETFTIYEKSLEIGGTWRDNTYPGCEVDTPSTMYSFSFTIPGWTRTHARQADLRKYLESVVDEFGLRPHIRTGVGVETATWDEATLTYRVELDDGTTTSCHVLVSAVGFLNVPRLPDFPGLDRFKGPVFHTARWEHDHDLTGKRIAIVGTGSSAAQIVPEVADSAKRLLLFQREPGWVMPKGERDFSSEEREALLGWRNWRMARLRALYQIEKRLWHGGTYRPGSKVHDQSEQICRDYIAKVFADRPDLEEAVTPTYPFWGKRLIYASTYYPALKRENVELIPRAVTRLTEAGVVDTEGVEHPADIVVLATGFQPTNYLAYLRVVGRQGQELHDYWNGEPRAFLGITVPGFPNFYMMYGPGTNGGEIIWMLERQAEYVVRAVRRMIRTGSTAIEVRRLWTTAYNLWLQWAVRKTAWTVSNNYFKASNGKVVTQWPYSPLGYLALTKSLGRWSETTRKA